MSNVRLAGFGILTGNKKIPVTKLARWVNFSEDRSRASALRSVRAEASNQDLPISLHVVM